MELTLYIYGVGDQLCRTGLFYGTTPYGRRTARWASTKLGGVRQVLLEELQGPLAGPFMEGRRAYGAMMENMGIGRCTGAIAMQKVGDGKWFLCVGSVGKGKEQTIVVGFLDRKNGRTAELVVKREGRNYAHKKEKEKKTSANSTKKNTYSENVVRNGVGIRKTPSSVNSYPQPHDAVKKYYEKSEEKFSYVL